MFATCPCVSQAAAFRGKRLNAEGVRLEKMSTFGRPCNARRQSRARASTCVGAWGDHEESFFNMHRDFASPFRAHTTSLRRPRKSDRSCTYERIDALCASPRPPPLSSPVSVRAYLDLSIRYINSKLQHPTTFSRRCVSCCRAMSDWKVNPSGISAWRNKRSTDPFTRRKQDRPIWTRCRMNALPNVLLLLLLLLPSNRLGLLNRFRNRLFCSEHRRETGS